MWSLHNIARSYVDSAFDTPFLIIINTSLKKNILKVTLEVLVAFFTCVSK